MRRLGNKLLVAVSATVLGLVLLDFGARAVFVAYRHRGFDRNEIVARLFGRAGAEFTDEGEPVEPVAQTAAGPAAIPPTIVHPYFGFIANPAWPGVNRYGFLGPEPFTTRSPDRLVVGLFGGSVADHMFRLADDVLINTLQESPAFAGRHVQLFDLAVAAYKQPQQLLILTTLLALGAQFDVVINLDGFNEIDAAKDNLQDGVNPFYPYMWKSYVGGLLDSETAIRLGRADAIRARREEIRRWFAKPPVAQSAFLLTLWDFLDAHEEAALRAETAAIRQATAARAPRLPETGPLVSFADDDAMYHEYVEVWARASLAMSILCAGLGIRYFHFLQPNQYLPGSKILTAEERRDAFDPDVADTHRVATGYPMLIERGRQLREAGVHFVDLTMLFKDDPRTIYQDTCCHVNERGSVALATAIGQAIADDSAGTP